MTISNSSFFLVNWAGNFAVLASYVSIVDSGGDVGAFSLYMCICKILFQCFKSLQYFPFVNTTNSSGCLPVNSLMQL